VANIDYNNQVITGPVTVPKSAVNSSFLDEAYKLMGLKASTSQVQPQDAVPPGRQVDGIEGELEESERAISCIGTVARSHPLRHRTLRGEPAHDGGGFTRLGHTPTLRCIVPAEGDPC
jgi:hypothetical protein